MDNEYQLDREAIVRTIREAEVVTFRFVTQPMRLLVDFRTSEKDGPMVKLVPKVESAAERFKSLKLLRPRFRLPRKISAIWWPRSVDGLRQLGIWDELVARVTDSGGVATATACDDVFRELHRLERAEVLNAIEGEGYRTVWPAGQP